MAEGDDLVLTTRGYPRCRYLRRVLRDFEQGAASRWEVEEAVTKVSATVIGIQVASKFTI